MENNIQLKKNLLEKQEEYNRKLNALFLKYKKTMGTRKDIIDFNQPVMLLFSKGHKVDFLEATRSNGLKSTVFKFKDSDNNNREVDMEGAPIYTLPYGGNNIKAYLYHENWFSPYNFENPLYSFKQFNSALAHTFSAEKKWEVEAKKAFALNWKYLAFIILALGVVLLIYLTMKGNPAPAQNVLQLGNQTLQIIQG